MSEGRSGGGVPGRRREPDGALSGPRYGHDGATLETVLAAAIRGGDVDPRAKQRAVAAFLAARDTGAHRARTRRRDDWRLPGERRARRPVRMTFGVVFASLTLGGVAVAAIGSVGSHADGAGTGRGSAHPSAVAPGRPGGTASSTSTGGPRPTDRPATAQDTEAHCRAYEQVQGRGKALDAKAWQQLVTAAGGKDEVAAYCSEHLARATAAPGKSGRGAAGADGATGRTGASGNGKAGDSGNGGSGTHSGGTGKAGGSGQGGGGKHK
ncbi:hypothetical protein ACH47Z_13825 [Streptomyces sp. NPDC020192]|uniref:hypothetical protein n=1 Tax=Streptomyces sp. NPDC020192 TaxID=3365066 RepID=UPI0037AC6E26